MPGNIRNLGDLLGGGALILIGGLFLLFGLQYNMGTPFRMGPGAFPVILASILILLGAGIVLVGMRKDIPFEAPRLRPLIFIPLSIVLFATITRTFGFLPAVALTIFTASAADTNFRPLPAAITSVVATAACWAVFILLLNLPLQLIRTPW